MMVLVRATSAPGLVVVGPHPPDLVRLPAAWPWPTVPAHRPTVRAHRMPGAFTGAGYLRWS